jgi:hypothetical protein
VKKFDVGLFTILSVAVVGGSRRCFAGLCSVPEAIAAEILFCVRFSGARHDGATRRRRRAFISDLSKQLHPPPGRFGREGPAGGVACRSQTAAGLLPPRALPIEPFSPKQNPSPFSDRL